MDHLPCMRTKHKLLIFNHMYWDTLFIIDTYFHNIWIKYRTLLDKFYNNMDYIIILKLNLCTLFTALFHSNTILKLVSNYSSK